MTRTKPRQARREEGSSSPETARTPSSIKDALAIETDGLRYELSEPPGRNGQKVVLTVRQATGGDVPPFLDRVDLYAFRSRLGFASVTADTFSRKTDEVMGHLALLLDQVERAAASERKPDTVLLTKPRRAAAEKLLRSPDLLARASKALEELGYVGEEKNKGLVYLVATSRLLLKPLSAILFAASGTGKSELLDKLAELVPPESVEFLSRLTPQALYYAGADHLRHKLVVVDEQAGATEADYAIRTLQTKGYLRLAIPVRGKTESFVAHGPIALLSGTTQHDLNPENLSRCLELHLDDSPEQTKRVQEAQRRAWAGEQRRKVDVEVWQDAQRLLEPLDVVIPFASQLQYPARTTKDRRDNQKLLTLVATHALLSQLQRERDGQGRVVAIIDDYRAVYELLRPLVEGELDGLSTKAAACYRHLLEGERVPVTRREVCEALGWSYMTAKRALEELLNHELVALTDGEYFRSYQVLEVSILGNVVSLTAPEKLKKA